VTGVAGVQVRAVTEAGLSAVVGTVGDTSRGELAVMVEWRPYTEAGPSRGAMAGNGPAPP